MVSKENSRKTVVAGALGECVHVAGVARFLELAELAGWKTIFLGPAVPIERFLAIAKREQADLIGVSYRLTPENGERLLGEFAEGADDLHQSGVRFVFGGTPPVVQRAKGLHFFDRCFDGSQDASEVLTYLKGGLRGDSPKQEFPASTIERIRWKSPFPLLRHHFGLPSVEETRLGIERIAKAQVLDVISLGIDQDAQANFFHPERQDPRARGAGGVAVRSAQDYLMLYQACQQGNYPLLRTYAGTDDFLQLAQMYMETIHNAWCAIPLFWFNQLDGRGPWDLEGSIRQHQMVMRWHGERGIPVELNEPHHWGMRDAPDVIYVVAAYLSAYNAKACGVQDYIAQMMFNSPGGLSDRMDLAKMQALLGLIAPLKDANFRIWRQTRTGLLSYPLNPQAARAHLATSIYIQMTLKPHIVHIVGHTEAHHAASAQDVIEAAQMAQRSIHNALLGAPDMLQDPMLQARTRELIDDAQITLRAIRNLDGDTALDPLTDPARLSRAVSLGILDAPHLMNNPSAAGKIRTRIDERGACVVVDPDHGQPVSEVSRLARFL